MSRNLNIGWARKLARNERGVATMEFALIAVVLGGLVLGVAEGGQRILDNQKVGNVAARVADLITQEASLTDAKIREILDAAKHLGRRDGFAEDGVVIVSGIGGEANGVRRVLWQQRGAGTLNEPSRIGTPGQAATLPADFVLSPGQTIVAVEVLYKAQGIVTSYATPTKVSVTTAYLRGRKGELAAITPASPPQR